MAPRNKRRRFRVETLESRRVLAAISILSTDDGEVIDTAPIDQIWDDVDTTSALIDVHELNPFNTNTNASRGIVEFDLSSIPTNNIDTAILTFTFTAVPTGREIGVYAYAGDGQVTLADAEQLNVGNLHSVYLGSTISSNIDQVLLGYRLDVDVLDKVNELRTAGENFMTIGFRAQSDGHGWRFMSDERPNNETPVLNITYNAAPVINDVSFSIDENVPFGTFVGQALASDPGDDLTYEIIGGNTDGAFIIDNDGRIFVENAAAMDFETSPVYSLIVQVTDSEGLTAEATVTINLNDLPDSLTPVEQIDVVIAEVQDLNNLGSLNNGQANPVLNHLDQAIKALNKGKTANAISKLEQSRDEIQDLIDAGDLDEEQGELIIDLINDLLSELQ